MEKFKPADFFEKASKVYGFAKDHMHKHTDLPYHNFDIHVTDVVDAAMRLGELERISYDDRMVLVTAALMHDVVYVIGAKDNEEKSAQLAGIVLPSYGYTSSQVDAVKSAIMATKLPTAPKSRIEEIICDADLDNLGRPDYFEKSVALRKEFGIEENKAWYERQLGFLKGHKYYTASANSLRGEGLQENIRLVENRINSYK